ncbi:LysR family transcriptional regulator [Rhodococcus sp. IEGM 1305]|uniref:LysR family transcriptional regulator n=1 Tax=Rhodococcus sp. IEGM 1305 TaxID=3047092 RepID=UPI0024B6BF45|nr:LysR family transcriptional regulator [Rhodococcus sp. IEGM 1305]MDI9949604.1 LysR family transcriptional regulator [Rhodococcus sp. IEGM 1305]
MNLTSSQLALLLAVKQGGSLARAAETLGITSPAVSQQLAKLERDLGALLVERGARGAKLTPLGNLLAEHSERVAAELSRAEETVAHYLGAHANRLRFGAFPSAAVALLPDGLTALRYRHPEAQLSVVDVPTDGGTELITRGELDMAITASYSGAPSAVEGVRFEHLLTDPLRVVLPDDHPQAQGPASQAVELKAFEKDAWACSITGRPARTQLNSAAADSGFVPWVPFQTESYDVAQALAASGVAVAFVPELALVPGRGTRARRLKPALARDVFVALPASASHVALAGELLTILKKTGQALHRRQQSAATLG